MVDIKLGKLKTIFNNSNNKNFQGDLFITKNLIIYNVFNRLYTLEFKEIEVEQEIPADMLDINDLIDDVPQQENQIIDEELNK